MRAALDDAAPLQDEDLVGVPDGAQALGDDEGGPPGHQGAQRLLDLLLGLGVDARGGVVQDQDARVEEERAGDRDPLLLPAGERDAPLADLRRRTPPAWP